MSSDPVRAITRVDRAALGVSLAPFLVAVVRAAVQHWMPVGDAAYFTVRSRDVLTSHTPLLGAWSSGSSVVGVAVNNLGPLQLDLLAPFTRLAPYLGTGIGSAVINAVSVALVWFVARRLFGPWRVVLVMVGTLTFLATLGLPWLVDARQQYALVLPFYALLWLVAAMASGVHRAAPLAVAVASVVVQTHFTYVYQGLLVGLFGVVAYVLVTRHDGRHRWRRTAAWSLAVGVVCWAQPLTDQFWGQGNLGDVLGPARRGQAGAGLSAGVQAVAGGVLLPPFWLPGSIGVFLQPYDGVSLLVAVLAMAVWLAAAACLVWWGARAGRRVIVALGATAAAALLVSVVGAALIPVSAFGLVPQNYYWVWSTGAFASIALVSGASCLTPATTRVTGLLSRRSLRTAAAVAMVVIAAVALWPRYPVSSVPDDENEADRIGRPLREQMAAAFQSLDDEVEVDLSRAFFANNYPFVMLVELQRAGVEFRFAAGSRNLDRFGESRCVEPGQLPRLLLIAGRDPTVEPGSDVLARVVGISDDELAEYADRQAAFGDLLRSGAMTVDVGRVRDTFGDAARAQLADIASILATPGEPATGLARSLNEWRTWGFVDIPSSRRLAFDRWFDLERRSSADYQTVVLSPPATSPNQPEATATC